GGFRIHVCPGRRAGRGNRGGNARDEGGADFDSARGWGDPWGRWRFCGGGVWLCCWGGRKGGGGYGAEANGRRRNMCMTPQAKRPQPLVTTKLGLMTSVIRCRSTPCAGSAPGAFGMAIRSKASRLPKTAR